MIRDRLTTMPGAADRALRAGLAALLDHERGEVGAILGSTRSKAGKLAAAEALFTHHRGVMGRLVGALLPDDDSTDEEAVTKALRLADPFTPWPLRRFDIFGREAVAYHEAAHLLAAYVRGGYPISATIVPQGATLGLAHYLVPPGDPVELAHADLPAVLAGAVGTAIRFTTHPEPTRHPLARAAEAAELLERYPAAFLGDVAAAKGYIGRLPNRRHLGTCLNDAAAALCKPGVWKFVDRLATHLLFCDSGTLDEGDLRFLLRDIPVSF